MAEYLCISVTFLDRRFHGRGDGGEPEWPPSPLRLMQAIVAANGDQVGDEGELDAALSWMENQPPPTIIAPAFAQGAAYCLSVPNNAMDLVGKAWAKGNYFGTGDASPATHRTMKTVRPIHLVDGDTVHYLWPLDDPASAPINVLACAAQRLVALGWGIDLVVGRAGRVTSADLTEIPGQMWKPTVAMTSLTLRTPRPGALQALEERYRAFLNRMGDDGLIPVPPLTQFDIVSYRRLSDPIFPPHAVFELRRDNDSFFTYPQRRLVHIAGMARHMAKRVMQVAPPADVDGRWIERYVVGHQQDDAAEHRQFSYLPLPSIGHPHADQAVRRLMIAAPIGDDAWLEHLARRLEGQQLIPERGDEFGDAGPPTLIRIRHDKVAIRYTAAANRWASVTPVILPGHDDRKPDKTRKLIETALAQSGIEQPCTFEWSAFSRFRKSYSAHKYDKRGPEKGTIGYIRPKHLLTQTAVHLVIEFKDGLKVPGPIAVGAGRHCGLGMMAGIED